MEMSWWFLFVDLELTGFSSKEVNGRMEKGKCTSTETTFNSRAMTYFENWRFLGDFITGFKLQILTFKTSHSLRPHSHLESRAIRKNRRNSGTNMNKSDEFSTGFCCECWNGSWLPLSWDLFRSLLASLVARSSAFQVILGFGAQVMTMSPISFHQGLNQGQNFMVKYCEHMNDQESKWRSHDLHQIWCRARIHSQLHGTLWFPQYPSSTVLFHRSFLNTIIYIYIYI